MLRMGTMIALAGAAVALAQPPGGMRGPQPAATELKTYLNLSDSQVSTLQQIQQQEMQAVMPTMRQIGQKHQAQQDLMQKGSQDAAAIGTLAIEIQNLEKQIATARDGYVSQALNVLTADQKTKLKALEDAQKLMPVIGQAASLNLLKAPQGAGFGPFGGPFGGGPFGPAGRGGARFQHRPAGPPPVE